MLTVLASRGLALLHITAPGESFAIGSLSIVRKHGDLRETDSEAWLPIASDVAVGIGFKPDTMTLIELADPEAVCVLRAISNTFSGASRSPSPGEAEHLLRSKPITCSRLKQWGWSRAENLAG